MTWLRWPMFRRRRDSLPPVVKLRLDDGTLVGPLPMAYRARVGQVDWWDAFADASLYHRFEGLQPEWLPPPPARTALRVRFLPTDELGEWFDHAGKGRVRGRWLHRRQR